MWFRIALIVIVSLSSCARVDSEYDPVDYKKQAKAEVTVVGEAMEMGVPVDLCVEGDFVYVLAYTNKWLHVYNRYTGELATEFMPIGRGPGEAVNVSSMDYDRKNKILYLHDAGLRKSVKYKIGEKIADIEYIGEVSHPKDGVINRCYLLPNESFLYMGYPKGYDKSVRFFVGANETVSDVYSEFPVVLEGINNLAFNIGSGKIHFESGRFVHATLYGAILETFNVSDEGVKSVGVRLLEEPRLDLSRGIELQKGTKWGFSELCPTKNMIYAVYINSEDNKKFTSISEFNWNAQEQAIYEAEHNILRLCENPYDKNSLYGIVSSPEMAFSLAKIEF